MSGAGANVPLDIRDGVSRRDENWAVILAARKRAAQRKERGHPSRDGDDSDTVAAEPPSLSRNPTLEKAHHYMRGLKSRFTNGGLS